VLLLAMALAPGAVLPQSATATVAGRVTGLPNDIAASFQVALAVATAALLLLQTAKGSIEVLTSDWQVASDLAQLSSWQSPFRAMRTLQRAPRLPA